MIEFSPSQVARLVADFDSSGIHRVGTAGDFASGEWLAAAARKAGAAVSSMAVAVNRTIVGESYLECEGGRIDGLPMFDSPPTSNEGISGKLAANATTGDIGYLDLPPNSASIKGMRFELIRRETKHTALIVATRVTGESLAPINAQFFDAPFGPPVVLVAGANHQVLAASANAQARSHSVVQRRCQRERESGHLICAVVRRDAAHRLVGVHCRARRRPRCMARCVGGRDATARARHIAVRRAGLCDLRA